MLAAVLFLLLSASGRAAAQQDQTEAERYAHFKERLEQTELALARYFFREGSSIPGDVQAEVERLDRDIEGSYFRDLAERSRMLVFLTREEAAMQEKQARSAEIGERLLREALADRRGRGQRRLNAAAFWSALAPGCGSLAASYALWYAGERIDQRYLGAASGDEAVVLKAWSKLLAQASLVCAGIGTLSLGVSIPALARTQPR